MFGKDIFFKPKPQVVSANIKNENASTQGEELFFGTKLSFLNNTIIEKEGYLDIVYGRVRINYTLTPPVTFKMSSSIPCSESARYRNNSEELGKIVGIEAFHCPPDDFYDDILGTSGEGSHYSFSARVTFCTNTTQNNNHCKPKEVIREQFKSFYVVVAHKDFLIDPLILDEPMSSFYSVIGLRLSSQASREETLYYKTFEMGTDMGFIMESISEKKYLYLGRRDGAIYPDDDPSYMFLLKVTNDNTKIKMIRSYIKVQKVAADIGGLIKFVTICVNIINNIYGKFHFLVYMRDKLVEEQREMVKNNNGGNKRRSMMMESNPAYSQTQKKEEGNNQSNFYSKLIRLNSHEQSDMEAKKEVRIPDKKEPCFNSTDQLKKGGAEKKLNLESKENLNLERKYSKEEGDNSSFPLDNSNNPHSNPNRFINQNNINIINNKIQRKDCKKQEEYQKRESGEDRAKSPSLNPSLTPLSFNRNKERNGKKEEEKINNYVNIEKRELQKTMQKDKEGQVISKRKKNSHISQPENKENPSLINQIFVTSSLYTPAAVKEYLSKEEEGKDPSSNLKSFWKYYCFCQSYKNTTLKMIDKYINSCYSIERFLEMKENQCLMIGGLFNSESQQVLKEMRIENTIHQVKKRLSQIDNENFWGKIREIKV
eukprot:CAMPEP_0170523418 /NCGR_PEP_ID=MMETSP0209-20121228/8846_1 /TAXON_ID=665100 ORGANISM="Litonotus pictus, Strain P1" /NCGR_SAMPLE_ID=MMETSP0209 /ASSEMBLY_ACC=CAM_ASM_000301 /LENGTH=653 /DNA_ID=CAMNT_0010811495 /DNA_START=94 /DNA_END=2055 /DNA_ORIENTATION=+